jgi:hypothetical protein
MKKNLKVMLPTLLIVLAAQFALVRYFVNQSNVQSAALPSDIDTTLPHPSARYDAKEVLQVVLYALRNKAGETTFWQFTTPRLRKQLRDKALIRPYLTEDLWKALSDFDSYNITHSKIEDEEAVFEVEILSSKRLVRQFVIAIHKQDGLWLIDQMVKRL